MKTSTILRLRTTFSHDSGAVVRFLVKRARKAAPAAGAPAAFLGRSWTMADRLQRERLAAEQLTTLLVDMKVPPIDEAAHQRLQRLIYLYGPEHATERCCPVRPQAAT